MIVFKKLCSKGMMLTLFTLVFMTSGLIGYANPIDSRLDTDVQPYWSNTSDMVVVLTINNGRATLSASIDGYSGVNKIVAVSLLERLNADGTYTEIERWNNISTKKQWLDWTATRYIPKGFTYRFTFIATVYKDGIGEIISGNKSVRH